MCGVGIGGGDKAGEEAETGPPTPLADQKNTLPPPTSGAFIPFLMAGDPDLTITAAALTALDAAGADAIELGVPYSDPLADGPTIQGAHTRGLEGGTTLADTLAMLKSVTGGLKAPIVLFTYYNPILRRGVDDFCAAAADAGVAGVLVPDIPLEETQSVRDAATSVGMELVLLVTPTTPPARAAAIAAASQGFVYLVSVAGVTGARGNISDAVPSLIAGLKAATDKPVAVGFGVSGPEQAKQIRAWGADGVIVGSALVKALGEAASPAAGLQAMSELAASIRKAVV